MGVGAITQGVRRAVFLDRDGVLNRAIVRDGRPYPPASIEELEVVEGAGAALKSLTEAGFLLFVVTNQPDVGRGTQRRSEVEAMHLELARTLPVDGFYVCYHDDADGCDCRKPQAGLLLKAAAEHGITLEASYMIGDRWRDVEAGQNAGCRTVWIDFGYSERGPARPPDVTVRTLAEGARWILKREEGLRG